MPDYSHATADPGPDPEAGDVVSRFWASRPVLAHIQQLARARMVGPFAVLAYAIAETLAVIPPYVRIPPIIGGPASLNACVAIVGPSGAGKGTSGAAARDRIVCGYGPTTPIARAPIGSGEGIARTFRPHGTGTDPDSPNAVTAAVFTADEIDSWSSLAARSGSTLSAEVRKVFSGEQIGFANSGKDTRLIVKAHSYRAVVVVGVQPERSAPILSESAGGLPQRFWWFPASDPLAPDVPPDDPGSYVVPMVEWHEEMSSGRLRDGFLTVPDVAVNQITATRRAILREEPGSDPLAAHSLLTRLKLSAGLMALDGRAGITDEDWRLSGTLMELSDFTRQRCSNALLAASRRLNTAKALATVEREELISDRKHKRAKEGILQKLRDGVQLPRNIIRSSLKSDLRECYDPAMDELLSEGKVIVFPATRGTRKVQVYQRSRDQKHTTTSNDGPCTKGPPGPHGDDLTNRRDNRERRRTRGKFRDFQQTSGLSP